MLKSIILPSHFPLRRSPVSHLEKLQLELKCYLCQSESFSFNVGRTQCGGGDACVQSSCTIAPHDIFAWEFGCLLEKRYIRTQATHILVNLQQEFVVFEKCAPRTLRTIAQRVIG